LKLWQSKARLQLCYRILSFAPLGLLRISSLSGRYLIGYGADVMKRGENRTSIARSSHTAQPELQKNPPADITAATQLIEHVMKQVLVRLAQEC
jgi:hypothetical protein